MTLDAGRHRQRPGPACLPHRCAAPPAAPAASNARCGSPTRSTARSPTRPVARPEHRLRRQRVGHGVPRSTRPTARSAGRSPPAAASPPDRRWLGRALRRHDRRAPGGSRHRGLRCRPGGCGGGRPTATAWASASRRSAARRVHGHVGRRPGRLRRRRLRRRELHAAVDGLAGGALSGGPIVSSGRLLMTIAPRTVVAFGLLA